MRVSRPMLRWLSAGIFALVFLLAAVIPVQRAIPGPTRYPDYIVTLEPQSNGQVRITYEQTVASPQRRYPLDNRRPAQLQLSPLRASAARPPESRRTIPAAFTGVRVDLDKDYLAGQTFNIKFTVLQGNLLERLTSEKKWRINFTPGWYDRATIDHLQINLVSPVDYQTYSSVSPPPTSVNNNVITWERTNLAPGGRFNIVGGMHGRQLSDGGRRFHLVLRAAD